MLLRRAGLSASAGLSCFSTKQLHLLIILCSLLFKIRRIGFRRIGTEPSELIQIFQLLLYLRYSYYNWHHTGL